MSIYPNNEKMCNGDLGDLEDQICGILGRLTTSTSRQKSFDETSPSNYSISSTLWMDSKPREITSSTDSTIPIPRLDMGFNNYDSSITERQTSKIFERTKNRKEKDLQKEDDFCKNSSDFDWDAFPYKDTIPESISLPQTTFYNTSYSCQRGRMGYMDSMTPSNISKAPMVEQYDNREQL
jgi:hypothetical protein